MSGPQAGWTDQDAVPTHGAYHEGCERNVYLVSYSDFALIFLNFPVFLRLWKRAHYRPLDEPVKLVLSSIDGTISIYAFLSHCRAMPSP